MKWISDNSNLDRVGYNMVTSGNITTALCCKNPDVHIYAHRHSDGKGGVWVWCSRCGRYAHLDRITINSNWKNAENIDFSKITVVPRYLETVKDEADRCLNEYIRRTTT